MAECGRLMLLRGRYFDETIGCGKRLLVCTAQMLQAEIRESKYANRIAKRAVHLFAMPCSTGPQVRRFRLNLADSHSLTFSIATTLPTAIRPAVVALLVKPVHRRVARARRSVAPNQRRRSFWLTLWKSYIVILGSRLAAAGPISSWFPIGGAQTYSYLVTRPTRQPIDSRARPRE